MVRWARMYLTNEQEKMLKGEYGEGTRKAMEIMTKIGDFYGAKEMVSIDMAYIVMGPDNYGLMLKYLKNLADEGARFRTLTYVGLMWRTSAPTSEYGKKYLEVYRKMGAVFSEEGGFGHPDMAPTYPLFGRYLVADGTNVTSYFNGVLGARANNMDPLGQHAAAIVGCVPKYGYLTKEGRLGKILVDVKFRPRNRTEWSALAWYISRTIGLRYWEPPVLIGLESVNATSDELSSFCAAIPTYGPINHFLIVGISPEARTAEEAFGGDKPKEKIEVGPDEIKQVYERFSSSVEKPDLISLGEFAPPVPLKRLYVIASLLEGKKVKLPTRINVSKFTRDVAERAGLIQIIESAGVEVSGPSEGGLGLVQSAKMKGIKVVVVDNAKACQYIGQQEVEPVLLDDETAIKVALFGKLGVV